MTQKKVFELKKKENSEHIILLLLKELNQKNFLTKVKT